MLSEVFYTILLTTITGFLLKLSSMAYKSKCKEIACGCIKIIRDTESEEKLEEFRILHPIVSPPEFKKENSEEIH